MERANDPHMEEHVIIFDTTLRDGEQSPGASMNAAEKLHIARQLEKLGVATANTFAGLLAGARQAEVTINGIGERAGNASLEEVVMGLHTRQDHLRLKTRINTEEIWPTSRLVSMVTGLVVPPNKAIVGVNAFSHESGIHQDGVLKNRMTYEIMAPEKVGLTSNRLVLGKHSGRHAFKRKLSELGYDLSENDLNRLENMKQNPSLIPDERRL